MEFVKRNRKLTVILSMLFCAALVHRTGVVASLLRDESRSSKAGRSADSVNPKSKKNNVVNLRHFNWPESNLGDLLEHSPFGIDPMTAITGDGSTGESGSDVDEAGLSSGTEPATVTGQLKAIYHSDAGPVALIGSQLVHVGDTLDDGRRVLAIHDRHLTLSEASTEIRIAGNASAAPLNQAQPVNAADSPANAVN